MVDIVDAVSVHVRYSLCLAPDSPGEYDTEVTLRSEQGEELVCLYVKLKIRGPRTQTKE